MIIAQISDIHAAPNNDNLQRLATAIVWLAALKPDCLVVTGDLVDGGWSEGYSEIGRQLGKMSCQVFVLPGNADDISAMKALLHRYVVVRSDVGPDFSELVNDVLLIGLDTTVPGAAHGAVRDSFPWLREQLEINPGEQAVLFTHHHVFPSGIKPMDDVMCRDTAAFAELLSSVPRKPLAICSGHVHRPMAGLFAGIPAYICGSICPANPLLLEGGTVPPVTDAPSLMVHGVKAGRLVSSHVSLALSC